MKYNILSWLVYLFVRVLKLTYRFKHVAIENREKAITESRSHSYVYSMWHQNVIPGMISQWGLPHYILVSASKDGDLINVTGRKMGYTGVRGSSTRGGMEALITMISKLSEGSNAAVTPDGPVGPPKKLKKGILDMAKGSGCAIVPLYGEANKYFSFNSWDKLRLPYPFSKIVIRYGKPIHIPEDIELIQYTDYRDQVVEEMNNIESLVEADLKNWNNL
ncbi:MAG: lysophospholipid acyltransferase family protein [Bacteriovoracaceae bacterium]|nr:lysophospholipid acyltransferase family protein [Bacteriovoracaceae bacterium]